MGDINAKKYFKRIDPTVKALNEIDPFAKLFLNILKSGNTTLYQKERRERRVFDDAWMTSVEDAIPVIDKITRSPRENLKKVSQVVPVERARKIDADTIRHLAANTQFIKNIDREGNVTPSKVLTSYNDSDLGTYENRFIKTLVDKLFIFIEKRYDLMIKKLHTEYVNYLNIKTDVAWGDATIDFDITMKINQNLSEDEMDVKNQALFDRMTSIRSSITQFKMSAFMSGMRQFPPVSPPIMKTNIILKNQDFRQCYHLWVLLDSINQIGYDVEIYEKDADFTEKYLEQLYSALMVFYATVANNQREEFLIAQKDNFDYQELKRLKQTKSNEGDIKLQPGNFDIENNMLNQFYLDQIRKANYSRFKTLKDAGISIEESVEIVFKQINEISNAVYEDYIQDNYNVDNKPKLEDKIKTQEDVLELFRTIEGIKRADLRQLQTEKAIALLDLRNFREEQRDLIAKEKIEIERKRAEEEARILAESEAEKQRLEKERLEKAAKIEKAKKYLEDAESKRQEKKQKERELEKARFENMKAKEKAKAKADKQKAIESEKTRIEKDKAKSRLAADKAKAQDQKRRDNASAEIKAMMYLAKQKSLETLRIKKAEAKVKHTA